jgi:hypothetical protein
MLAKALCLLPVLIGIFFTVLLAVTQMRNSESGCCCCFLSLDAMVISLFIARVAFIL